MNKARRIAGVIALALAGALGAVAQNTGRLSGTVYDLEGKPWPDVSVTIQNGGTGQSFNLKTDKKGHYLQIGLGSGIYTITFHKDQVNFQKQARVAAGEEQVIDINLKEEVAKNAQYAEEMKKQEEEKQKFANVKVHFDDGIKALNQARELRSGLAAATTDRKPALEQQIAQLDQTAINEFQTAVQAADPKERNLALILANLGVAYESAGKYEDAAASFQKAVELKPTDPNYFLGLATNLARVGKVREASDTCAKAAALNPANAATCWHNIGAVLYNSSKVKEAVEPLRKATEADPKNADNWYLFGAALLNTMGSKMEGSKLVAVVQPGTAEAYQRYLELAPHGPHAAEAQAALDTLKQLGAGVETRVEVRKKKKE